MEKNNFAAFRMRSCCFQETSSSSSASSGATTFPHPNGVQAPNLLDDWDSPHHAPPRLLHTFLAFDAQTTPAGE